MTELIVSKDFTLDDIRKIREHDAARRSHMSLEEISADIAKGANEVLARIEEIRRRKQEELENDKNC